MYSNCIVFVCKKGAETGCANLNRVGVLSGRCSEAARNDPKGKLAGPLNDQSCQQTNANFEFNSSTAAAAGLNWLRTWGDEVLQITRACSVSGHLMTISRPTWICW
jgi:hypothetical protein